LDFASFPYQKGDRYLVPSIVKRPSTTGSELPIVVDAACAAIFQQTIVRQTHRYPTDISTTQVQGGSFQRWWRAGRGRGTEREPLSVMRCKFQPRACISTCSFLLEGRSGSSLSSRTEPPARRSRNLHGWYYLRATTSFLFRRRGRDAGSTPISEQLTCFSPNHVFPRGFRSYREGISCS